MRYLVAGVCTAFLLGLFTLSGEPVTGGEKPKTIKEVMKIAHSGKVKLCAKVASGKASDDEKKALLQAYEVLASCKSPTGQDDDWKAKTSALVKAVKDGDGKALGKAVNCAACHKVHKPK